MFDMTVKAPPEPCGPSLMIPVSEDAREAALLAASLEPLEIEIRKRALRVLLFGDFHCGHEVGLTPPEYNPVYGLRSLQRKSDYRGHMWNLFAGGISKYGPFDVAVADGDLIDGRGERIGANEEVFVDRHVQVAMATRIIQSVRAKENYILRGTDYHVGPYENFEDLVGEQVGAKRVGDILRLSVNGLIFNVRHHIGGSQVPHGRATALLRDWLWDVLWASQQNFDKSDVIIRAHVHYALAISQPGIVVMTIPALQGYGTRYGERRLSGLIHYGFTVFDIVNKENFTWKTETYPFPVPPMSVVEVT